jgi:hypothetical protein
LAASISVEAVTPPFGKGLFGQSCCQRSFIAEDQYLP